MPVHEGPTTIPTPPPPPPAVRPAPVTTPVAPARGPAPAPTPPRPRPHGCVGTWQGNLLQSDGAHGRGVVTIHAGRGQCGSFVERWSSGSVCHYELSGCSTSGSVLRARARTPPHERCSPVQMRFTCEGGWMRFYESASNGTVTSNMTRR